MAGQAEEGGGNPNGRLWCALLPVLSKAAAAIGKLKVELAAKQRQKKEEDVTNLETGQTEAQGRGTDEKQISTGKGRYYWELAGRSSPSVSQ